MKDAAKKTSAALASALLAISFSLFPLAKVSAATSKSYLKEFGGDVAVGGWFNSGTTSCVSSPSFQDDGYKPDGVTPDALKSYGGIYTFANQDGSGNLYGSSSQFDAFALGSIDGNNSGNGFYTGNIRGNKNTLSFANIGVPNTPAGYWSGLWGGSLRNASNCIPDYYGTSDKTPTDSWPGTLPNNLTGDHVYVTAASGTTPVQLFNGGNVTVAPSAHVTVFVDGSVYLNSNIAYAPHTVKNIPRLSIVAKGDIIVDRNVGNLEGLFIAQPDPTDAAAVTDNNAGVFWTCDDGTQTSMSSAGGAWIATNCNKKLTVRGAVIAKQFFLFRVNGDILGAPQKEAAGSGNIAEEFDFTPEMYLGGPMLPGSTSTVLSSSGSQPVFDSVLSLPPTF